MVSFCLCWPFFPRISYRPDLPFRWRSGYARLITTKRNSCWLLSTQLQGESEIKGLCTHAVFPPDCAFLHILCLPCQFLPHKQTHNHRLIAIHNSCKGKISFTSISITHNKHKKEERELDKEDWASRRKRGVPEVVNKLCSWVCVCVWVLAGVIRSGCTAEIYWAAPCQPTQQEQQAINTHTHIPWQTKNNMLTNSTICCSDILLSIVKILMPERPKRWKAEKLYDLSISRLLHQHHYIW